MSLARQLSTSWAAESVVLSNLRVYERIARDAQAESQRLLKAGRRPKPGGEPGYIVTFDSDQQSFKSALIAIVFAGIYLESLLYLEGTSTLGKNYDDRACYEQKLEALGVTDPQVLEQCRDFRISRKRLVHEKAGSPADLGEIRVGQDDAERAIAFLDAVVPALKRSRL